MSIIQEFYNIYDKEESKYLSRKSSKNLLLIELSQNLSFLREGLNEEMDLSEIISSLENDKFKKANNKATDINSIQKKNLNIETYRGIKEFKKYKGWSTKKLINNAYERIAILKKLNIGSKKINTHSRLQYLFKYLMLVMAHINGKHLVINSNGRKKRTA